MKHTPGPWTTFEFGHEYPGIDAEKISIVVWGENKDGFDMRGVQGKTREEAQANARLIATAPEMLEALEEAKQTLLIWMTAFPNLVDTTDCNTIDKASEVIAKAKGES